MNFVVNGIILGSIIALGAIGLSLTTAILNFYNFAHGASLLLGAYMGYTVLTEFLPRLGLAGSTFPYLSFGWPMIIAILGSMGLTAGIMIAIDRFVYKPLRDRGSGPLILGMSSLFMALMLRNLVRTIWGPSVHYYSNEIQMVQEFPLGIRMTPDQIFIIGLTVLLVVLTQLFLKRTKMGQAMRAASDNIDLAMITGIDTEKVVIWTWGVGTALAAVAGVLYGINVQLRPMMGWYFLLPLFAAVIIGGEGNFYGALAGAMTVGIAQEVGTPLLQNMFDSMNIQVSMTGYKPAIAFILMVIVLLVRSYGEE